MRERKRAATRARVEAAALRLFATQGYANTTISEIAATADIAERTFFLYFSSKEDVVLGDIELEMAGMADALAQRAEGESALELFRALGDQRVDTFRRNSDQVRWRREIEAANPDVHARAIAYREQAEAAMLVPEFARDLGLPESHPHVALLVAAFTGISGVLDPLFETEPDDHAARRVLNSALTALTAMKNSLQLQPDDWVRPQEVPTADQ
jgi:AcrR family transcriptional regulator